MMATVIAVGARKNAQWLLGQNAVGKGTECGDGGRDGRDGQRTHRRDGDEHDGGQCRTHRRRHLAAPEHTRFDGVFPRLWLIGVAAFLLTMSEHII
jgi:hypothetical protein